MLNSQNNTILTIAFRYLKSQKYKFLPSLGVGMAISATSLSIAILIIVTSVMNGFREELLSKIIGVSAHINIVFGNNSFNQNIANENINDKDGMECSFPGNDRFINSNNPYFLKVAEVNRDRIRKRKIAELLKKEQLSKQNLLQKVSYIDSKSDVVDEVNLFFNEPVADLIEINSSERETKKVAQFRLS